VKVTTEDTYEEKNMKEAKKTLALAKSEEILSSRKGKGKSTKVLPRQKQLRAGTDLYIGCQRRESRRSCSERRDENLGVPLGRGENHGASRINIQNSKRKIKNR
jgi:hypothetical protein